MDLQLRLVLVVLGDAVRHGQQHAGEAAGCARADGGETYAVQSANVDPVLHGEALEPLADVERDSLRVGEEQHGWARVVDVRAERQHLHERSASDAFFLERLFSSLFFRPGVKVGVLRSTDVKRGRLRVDAHRRVFVFNARRRS